MVRVMRGQWLGALFICAVAFPSFALCFFQNLRFGNNGGLPCAGCTLVVGVAGQAAKVKGTTIIEETQKLCAVLPRKFFLVCNAAFLALDETFGDVYRTISDEITPDVVCYGIGLCHGDPGKERCHLFPPPASTVKVHGQPKKAAHSFFPDSLLQLNKPIEILEKITGPVTGSILSINLCDIVPGLRLLCDYLHNIFSHPNLRPLIDYDGDKFSTMKESRGAHWRGKDCDDWNKERYPGRMPNSELHQDENCNGIWGVNELTGIPWETEMCEPQTGTRGLIYMGDSMGAHFHIPEVWMNPLLAAKHPETMFSFIPVLLDEFDWPQLGFATGFTNGSNPVLIQGLVDSIYLRLFERNRCNHRDFQNLCRNGAASEDMIPFVDAISRGMTDKPALVMIGVFGNDVCNRFSDTLNHMTTPAEFHSNIDKALDKLSSRLPTGSHVVLLGLADASFIYPTLSERIHPIGKLYNNVKYKDLYKWFECIGISPCLGWLNADARIREATTKAAEDLTKVLKNLAKTAKFKNFQLHFIPHPLSLAIEKFEATGGKLWEIMEAVDGFHPNQKSQPFIAEAIWSSLQLMAPDALGVKNPHNEWIQLVFKKQNGY